MKKNKQYSTGVLNLSATKKQTLVFLQIIIFSLSLLCAAILWLMTHSLEGTIYGFMLGTLSTIIAVFLQCHKTGCLTPSLTVFASWRKYSKTLFFLVKPIIAIMIPLLYPTSIAY